VHDGGPRMTEASPELIWVRVSGIRDNVFTGEILNNPHNLHSVRQGSKISFIVAGGAPHPIMVTTKYVNERQHWKITGCEKCGFAELFDAPSDLQARLFPTTPPDSEMLSFTSFCPLCGGVQVVEAASSHNAH
jgi:hypothetical protein